MVKSDTFGLCPDNRITSLLALGNYSTNLLKEGA